jgi:hypothetical protein
MSEKEGVEWSGMGLIYPVGCWSNAFDTKQLSLHHSRYLQLLVNSRKREIRQWLRHTFLVIDIT